MSNIKISQLPEATSVTNNDLLIVVDSGDPYVTKKITWSNLSNSLPESALSSRTITAGSGLIGGGDLSANRVLHIGSGDGIIVSADSISIDSTVIRTTGNQTISDVKTFASGTQFDKSISIGNIENVGKLDIFYADLGYLARFGHSSSNIALNGIVTFGSAVGGADPVIIQANGYQGLRGAITSGVWRGDAIQIEKGGTGRSSYSNGQLLIGSGTSLAVNTLTSGSGINIVNGSGSITVNALKGSGITIDSNGIHSDVVEAPNDGITYGRKNKTWVDITSPANLQFRRGTASEVSGIIPLEGEPVWATDSKALYMGDGSTLGGNLIGNYSKFLDFTSGSTGLANNDIYNTAKFLSLNTLNSVWQITTFYEFVAADGDCQSVINLLPTINNVNILMADVEFSLNDNAALFGSLSNMDTVTVSLLGDEYGRIKCNHIIKLSGSSCNFGLPIKANGTNYSYYLGYMIAARIK